jgi:DNA-binding NarL/FixJ family response regulator
VAVKAQLAIAPSELALNGLRSAVQQDPDLALVDTGDGVDSLVELIAGGRLDVALLEVDDPGAALAALSRLAADDLPHTGIALTGSGAADLVYALRRLGLRAEAIDAESSPAEICGQLARLARRDAA